VPGSTVLLAGQLFAGMLERVARKTVNDCWFAGLDKTAGTQSKLMVGLVHDIGQAVSCRLSKLEGGN